MKQLILFLIMSVTAQSFSQNLKIIKSDKTAVDVSIIDRSTISDLISAYNGKKDTSKFKDWTSKTYLLNDNRLIVEFFDKQGILINNETDFNRLKEIRFVKNQVWDLKKNISYKIELGYKQGLEIIKKENPKRLSQFKSDMPEYFDFEVYQLADNQILFIDKSENNKSCVVYPDIKTLASDNTTVTEQYYGSDDEEGLMKKLAKGDNLVDYEPNEHLIYPKYIDAVIKSHKLKLIEQKVYIREFYGNLYKSEDSGLYFLIDEVNQKNGGGNKMAILELNIFESLEEVKKSQKNYQEFKDVGFSSEHFYKTLSDRYGENFPRLTTELINKLPETLNVEKEKLTFNSKGIEIIDEAILWNREKQEFFDEWFPSVLAFYGQYYIESKKDGKWVMTFDKEDKIWIPQLQLKDGKFAWDWRGLYKGLYEGSIKLDWYKE
jgi:hypothetical protein